MYLHGRDGKFQSAEVADTAGAFNANADMAAEELERGTNRCLRRRIIPANSSPGSGFPVHGRDIMTLGIFSDQMDFQRNSSASRAGMQICQLMAVVHPKNSGALGK